MRFSKFFLSLLFLVSLATSHAQDVGHYVDVESKIIARDLDAMSFILKLGDEVESKQGIPMSEAAWANDLADASMELMKRAYADGPQERAIIEKFRKVFKWNALWAKTKELAKYVKTFSRHKGIAAAFILVSTGPSDFYLPAILTAIGKPELIAVTTVVPITPIMMWGESSIQNFRSARRIRTAMGGAQAFRDFLKARKEVLAELGAKASEYIHPLSVAGDELQAIVVAKSGTMKKLLAKLGVKEKGVTLGNVKKFLKTQNLLEDQLVKSILTQELPDEVKAGQLIYHLRYQRTDEIAYDVLAEFHESFRSLKISPAHGALWETYQSLVSAKSVAEIREALNRVPSHVDPKLLAQLWKEKLIPEWSKSLDDISVFEFRRLVTNFDAVYGSLIAPSASQSFDAASREKLFGYLDKVQSSKEACSEALEAM